MSEQPSAANLQASLAQWRADLQSWAIPESILSQAPEPPWIHPVSVFTAPDDITDSPSHRRAREAVPADGSVLDVGSGGGRAAFALVPPAGTLVAVEQQQGMLDAFAAAAVPRGVRTHGYLGQWPAVADDVPLCDVVVCHHVVYNVADIGPFIAALSSHARRRVVLEVPMEHPTASMSPLWKHFWDLDRPTRPTALDLVTIVRAMGFAAQIEEWDDVSWGRRVALPDSDRIRFARVRLCLASDRDAEVAAALIAQADDRPRPVATIWWDVAG